MKIDLPDALTLVERVLREGGQRLSHENKVSWALLRPTGRELYLIVIKILREDENNAN